MDKEMDKERKYREDEIEKSLLEMKRIFYELSFLQMHTVEEDKKKVDFHEEKDNLESQFQTSAKNTFRIITAYLEILGYSSYLEDFKNEFIPIISDKNKLFDGDFNTDYDEVISKTESKFWSFLYPFEFSKGNYLDRLINQTGIIYLERVLKNTQKILHALKIIPKSEPEIYKAVRFFIQMLYPSTISPISNFNTSFKSYRPDILIPDLYAAVEYKYANKESTLKSLIEQVAVDSKGYTGDSQYKLFYAVFYVTNDFWGTEKFEVAWKEMKFPKNWKGFYIIGK